MNEKEMLFGLRRIIASSSKLKNVITMVQ